MSRHGSDNGRNPRSESGFGLIEVLISVVIFATALLGLVATSASVGATVNSQHVRTRAQAVARAQLEDLIRQPYEELSGGAVQSDGVVVEWIVTEAGDSKEIVLAYEYGLKGGARRDTLTAARRRS